MPNSVLQERSAKRFKKDNLFLWTVFLLLLAALVFACWLGSFYIFGHPENARAYRLLKRLNKISPPVRFVVTKAPPGEFLEAQRLFERYSKYTALQLERENELLFKNYLRNYTETKKLVPYLTGKYLILKAYELQRTDLFDSGVVVLTQSADFPQLLAEVVYPTKDRADVPAMLELLQPGLEVRLQRTHDLSAIVQVGHALDGRMQVSVVPLLYGNYALKNGVGSFSLAPPETLNVGAGFPLVRGEEVRSVLRESVRRRAASTANGQVPEAPGEIVRVDETPTGGSQTVAGAGAENASKAPAQEKPVKEGEAVAKRVEASAKPSLATAGSAATSPAGPSISAAPSTASTAPVGASVKSGSSATGAGNAPAPVAAGTQSVSAGQVSAGKGDPLKMTKPGASPNATVGKPVQAGSQGVTAVGTVQNGSLNKGAAAAATVVPGTLSTGSFKAAPAGNLVASGTGGKILKSGSSALSGGGSASGAQPAVPVSGGTAKTALASSQPLTEGQGKPALKQETATSQPVAGGGLAVANANQAKPFIAATTPSSPTQSSGNWKTYAGGKQPAGKSVTTEQAAALQGRNDGAPMYLRGKFVVTAAGGNRAVLRQTGAGDELNKARVIVEYPAGGIPPQQGSAVAREDGRGFEIREVRRSPDGQVNIFVREVNSR